ncbi:MAG: MerR family transcriptional regulator [Defluviitaleaceae bacterium]|nr:MerR family transcriptional regulator [Defluviitaleaceae bacterium]
MDKYRAIPEGYMRVGEMAKKAGITVRTLQYYDTEGLLLPSAASDGGFRLYDDKDMVRLIQILMLKQLGLPLSEIKKRLTHLDTPQDVLTMLAEQAAQVRSKIKTLTDSLEAMESLSTEIAQIEAVNFKKYADILLNLQQKNESYLLIKHFDDEEMDVFRTRLGREKAALIPATLHSLYEEAAALLTQKATPESTQAQSFAEKFWHTLQDLSDGNMDLMHKLKEQMENASALEMERGLYNAQEQDAVHQYMHRALSIYLEAKFDMPTAFYDLHNQAAALVEAKTPPASEHAQAFAAAFWHAIQAHTGGDPDKIRALDEKAAKEYAGKNSVKDFIKQTLDIYFKNLGGNAHG